MSRYNNMPSSPIDSSYHPTSNPGHFGSDGAPSSRFMSPIPQAASANPGDSHSRPHIAKLNIAKSQQRPVQDRFNQNQDPFRDPSGRTNPAPHRPAHHPPQNHHHHSQQQQQQQKPFKDPVARPHPQNQLKRNQPDPLKFSKNKLSPPEAAFVDPESPTRSIQSFESMSDHDYQRNQGHHPHNQSPLSSSMSSSSSASSNQRLMKPSVVPLQKFESNGYNGRSETGNGGGGESDWLQKQKNSRRRFNTIAAVSSLVVLLILAVSVVAAVKVKKSGESAPPKALSWANGETNPSSIPSFAKPASAVTMTTATSTNKKN